MNIANYSFHNNSKDNAVNVHVCAGWPGSLYSITSRPFQEGEGTFSLVFLKKNRHFLLFPKVKILIFSVPPNCLCSSVPYCLDLFP